jgi:hypothetical protein
MDIRPPLPSSRPPRPAEEGVEAVVRAIMEGEATEAQIAGFSLRCA